MLFRPYFGVNVTYSTFRSDGVEGERCLLDPSRGDMIEEGALSLPFSFDVSSDAVVGEGAKRDIRSYGNMSGDFSITVVREFDNPGYAAGHMFAEIEWAKDVRDVEVRFFSPHFPYDYRFKGVISQVTPSIPLDVLGGKRLYVTYNFLLSEL